MNDNAKNLQPTCTDTCTDSISRQALCEYALNQKDKNITPNDIMRFPSAQPEKRTDKSAETHACDCISRQAVIDAYGDWYVEEGTEEGFIGTVKQLLEGFPPAQPERKRGRWRHYEGFLTCSECRTEYDDDIMTHCCDDVPKFCPNCGADMKKESE